MDCVGRNMKIAGIGWQDVCDIPESPTQNQNDKTAVVNQQLNMFDSPQSHADNVAQQFSNTPPESQTPSNMKTRVHTFDAGSELFYYRYEEHNAGVKMHGPMYGYFADYSYRPASSNFFNNFLTDDNVYSLQGRYATSNDLDYKGSGIEKDKHDQAMEFRGLIGKDYAISQDAFLTPYFGFGYRYLFDHGNGDVSSTGAVAYDRKSHYYYLPFGGDAQLNMPKNWEVHFNAEYDLFLQGSQKTYMSNLSNNPLYEGHTISDITNHQSRGFGVRGSIKLLKKGALLDYYIEPYIRYWNIRNSKLAPFVVDGVEVETGGEPENNTYEIGSKFGIQF
jgi:hypothetical protein